MQGLQNQSHGRHWSHQPGCSEEPQGQNQRAVRHAVSSGQDRCRKGGHRTACKGARETESNGAPCRATAGRYRVDMRVLECNRYGSLPVAENQAKKNPASVLRSNAGHMGNHTQDLRLLSAGSSNGTIGPFRGKTLQVFPADKPGTYVNVNNLFGGALRLELDGVYSAVSPTKIELEFGEVRGILWGVTVRCSSNVYGLLRATHLLRR